MQEDNMTVYKKRVEIIKFEGLQGMETLWRLAFEP
jgi:hypothetical protein